MELFRDTHIDFLRYRRFWIGFSIAVILLGVLEVAVGGPLNLGIDFAGGHQVTIRFAEPPAIDSVRHALDSGGVRGAQVQRFGEEHELLIRAPLTPGVEGETADILVSALAAGFPSSDPDALDLNRTGESRLASLLLEADPEQLRGRGGDDLAEQRYRELARTVLQGKGDDAMFSGPTEVAAHAAASGLGPEVAETLRTRAAVGPFAVLSQESVGPQVGAELRGKALAAVALSLLAMMIYIWFRFELRYGIGAIMASLHDVLVTFGLFAIAGFEFNLTTVAAFLTLVGYSVNDTVVVFDRVRENIRLSPRVPLLDSMNRSLNQTLSRTVLTSGTTLLASGSLLLLGGDVLRGFAFVLTIGIVVGTYSSVYIASPFALLWERLSQRRAPTRGAAGASPSPTPGR